MTFTVETGAVVADANAYITVAEFRAFHVDRGLTAAGADTGLYGALLVQSYIVKATDYVDKRFSTKFKGFQKQNGQSLQWPRMNVFNSSDRWIDSNTIPIYLKRAICEYSFLAAKLLDNELLPTPSPNFNRIDLDTGETDTSSGGPLYRNREKVGPIEEEQWFSDPTKLEQLRASGQLSSMVSSINLPEYPRADEWLKEIIEIGGTINLVRA